MRGCHNSPVLVYATCAMSEQIPIPASSLSACPQYTTPTVPLYEFSSFAYTQLDAIRRATSIPAPTTTRTYAAGYSALSYLIPDVSTTSWGNWDPSATTRATDTANPYGNAAWSALWESANLPDFTFTGLYSTTVEPTSIPSSKLILPPADHFGPADCYTFPEDFVFGVAGSAGQIEGAVAMEGRGPSLLEISIQDSRPKNYVTNENYFLYKQDIERLAAMGVPYYSFSISWTRILPFALPGTPVNEFGLKHYDDLINFVLEKGMLPVATLIHFDTPLQFYGSNLSTAADRPTIGFVNGGYQNETFEDAFVHYGKIVLAHYAERVPIWFTYNEPLLHAFDGASVNNVIKSHARLYHFYKNEIKGRGKISLKFNDNFGIPLDATKESHIEAAEHFNSFQLGTFSNPIFLGQDYPESFKKTIPNYVPLSASDLSYINNTADFYAVDPYTATVVSPPPEDKGGITGCAGNRDSSHYPYCVVQAQENQFGWNIGYRSQTYVYITPKHLRQYLNYLWNTFRKPIVLGEFGFPVFSESILFPAGSGPLPPTSSQEPTPKFPPGPTYTLSDALFDTPRSMYYLSYLSETLKAIWEDHVHVLGAFAWSFADNWEFGDYESRFGIQAVNRTDQTRHYKRSFFDLVRFWEERRHSSLRH